MNPHPSRKRHYCLRIAATLILGSTGFLVVKSPAQPLGKGGKDTGGMVMPDNPYTIGPDDVLQINVWHEPEISGLVPVRPDGKISVALIGDMSVAGLTPMKLQAALTQKLHAYISDPEVSVTVEQIKSRNFNVLGEVQHPGLYPLAHPVSILDAIGMAGGFRDFAKVTRIYVLRKAAGGDTVRLFFNYKQVIKGNAADQNVELRPEDTVVVP